MSGFTVTILNMVRPDTGQHEEITENSWRGVALIARQQEIILTHSHKLCLKSTDKCNLPPTYCFHALLGWRKDKTSNCSRSTKHIQHNLQLGKSTQQNPKHRLAWHLFVVQRYSHIQVDSSAPPPHKKRRCLEIKITSKQRDQTGHPQTSSPEIFLTPGNYFTIPFLTHSTSPPNQKGKAGKSFLIFRMALLKVSLLSLVLESTQYLVCTNCIHFGTSNTKNHNLLERKNVLRLNDEPSHLWWVVQPWNLKIK